MVNGMKTLVLGLGNDIIADDAIGVLAAQKLEPLLEGQADVMDSSVAGMALLEILMDYDRAIIIDAIVTGKNPPGTITEMKPEELGTVAAPSAHYAGLPEVVALAKQMDIKFPQEMVILAMEVKDALTIGGEMSAEVLDALPALIAKVQEQFRAWEEQTQ
ncbi:hydrogenase maturation protease [bacterium]|nr:hydrogenase maturation protease [bacterium]